MTTNSGFEKGIQTIMLWAGFKKATSVLVPPTAVRTLSRVAVPTTNSVHFVYERTRQKLDSQSQTSS
jgi:hypothetical protein